MIKTKKCKLCDKPAFSKGFCQQHMEKTALKSGGSIKKVSSKGNPDKVVRQTLRSIYFDYHIERCTHSEESGKSITAPSRTNICHLFDKSRHESLQDNLHNYVYLTFEEHQRFDQLLFSLRFEDIEKEFKNSWSKALIRIKKLLPLCEENTVFTRAITKYLNEDGRSIESK